MTDSGPFTYASDELDALAGAVNYYRWIMESFGPRLGRRIVEVGAGVGTFSSYLLEAAPEASLTAIEPAANNVPVLRERCAGEPRVAVRQGYLDETLEAGSADTVVAVNVMEHVEDDAAFLRAAHRLLTPGGHLLLFVPAVPAIFGTLDEAFEHFRRYTKRELDEKVRAAGFRVDVLRYVNLPGVAAWWLSGKVLRRRTITASAARTYDRWVIPWISALERRWSPPIGQSLLLVARKEQRSGVRPGPA